jgi:hypothetical protein
LSESACEFRFLKRRRDGWSGLACREDMMRNGTVDVMGLQAMRIGREGGELAVLQGCVWLTRRGDPRDHFVAAGERFRLGAGDDAVIESAARPHGAVVRWDAEPRPWRGSNWLSLL